MVGHEFVGVEVDAATDVVVADAPFVVAVDDDLFVDHCEHAVVEMFVAVVVAVAVAVVVVVVAAFVG